MIKTGPKERTIWLVAQSNVAVRNITEKLDKVGFRDFKLLVSKDFHHDWHEDLYQSLEHFILCTLSTLSNPNIDTITRIVSVQTVIFDEASQIEVGDYVPLLQHFQNSLKKMVFIGDDKQPCRFLDVKMGREESVGHSWINQKEISAVIGLARLYETQGKKFKILTPYDAQRTKIEEQLKSAELLWEDKCFNVDSFQGNEEDHIIVSLVRSQGVGFLKNVRRTNVMLTRCKKSMIICTSRDFVMRGQAAGTLVGKLAVTMGPQAWQDTHRDSQPLGGHLDAKVRH
ncbi:AAA domain-containing protein [Suillus subalutaceus]|uniref:AAA domain-containing protein n=1 Tax=Suillus subalutaceus TaxID=48586 RepID=UPI001B880D97|nr:AAA domain-containing protein [Suillus subalutaceus]KAG1840498.1 AAA domain-containing protein [Suillus subalutaceus]